MITAEQILNADVVASMLERSFLKIAVASGNASPIRRLEQLAGAAVEEAGADALTIALVTHMVVVARHYEQADPTVLLTWLEQRNTLARLDVEDES